ncbi:uncharacterized protein SAPINGB_P005638 [Magnusiomyces paraingens]|uniref:PCI domain-containing protein n=1 Tax=Magnusiomyces paraingens TaxID=2606893 RepID=A0A5E8C1Q0_9ASCO|nr:uncharacterized protein SAPINGB_P005638 [Saprochaete ingens]VVT57282.1 unnamed protein product [Saprochaete ingens]
MTLTEPSLDHLLNNKPSVSNVTFEGQALTVDDVLENFVYLEKAVSNFDPKYMLQVLRGLPSLRKNITPTVLYKTIETVYPKSNPSRAVLLSAIDGHLSEIPFDESMDIDKSDTKTILPEIDIFLHLLVQTWLLHQNDLTKFKDFNEETVKKLASYNRRSLDYLAAKVWFYYSWGKELNNELEEARPLLLNALRSATLRHDMETQASLITLLLRSYLATHHVSQAENLVSKITFPESAANALVARYFYYLAKINAIKLDYSAAHEHVTAAIRKAPQTPLAAGFLQTAQKLNVVVELLMGVIPEKSVFKQAFLEKPLLPYFDVAKAVRIGDIIQFSETIKKHSASLKKDGTYTLVLRLRQNVIKTGIRTISLSYSKISLKDICIKLQLDSEESTEHIIAKAIRDGVIDATIDHEHGYMQSNEVLDVYSTLQPQEAFHERIKFCIALHNDSVKAMRYVLSNHNTDLKNAEQAREREKELANGLQSSDLEDDDGNFDI